MRLIQLTQGKVAIVDNADFELLSQYKWHYNALYAVGKVKGRRIYMHRFLLNPSRGLFTDHVNGNRLDNRRGNLRVCTNRQNQQNRAAPSSNSSGIKGVTWHRQLARWQAQIMVNSKQIYLGVFIDLEKAKVAYNKAAQVNFGRFAKLN